MKYFFTLALTIIVFVQGNAAVITIAAARASATGDTVTIRGIVSNGAEFGSSLRYIQDGTAGVALFDGSLSSLVRGDSVEVVGTVTTFYNLLEISVSNFTVINSGNVIHPPVVLSIPFAYLASLPEPILNASVILEPPPSK